MMLHCNQSQAGITFRYRAAMCFFLFFFFLCFGRFIYCNWKEGGAIVFFDVVQLSVWIIFLTYEEQGQILSVGVVYVQSVYTTLTFIVVLVLYSAQWALNEKRARVWFKCHLAALKSYFKWTVKGLSSCFLVRAYSLQSPIASVLRPIDITRCRRPHSFTFTLIFSEWSQWNGLMLVQCVALSSVKIVVLLLYDDVVYRDLKHQFDPNRTDVRTLSCCCRQLWPHQRTQWATGNQTFSCIYATISMF